MGYPTGFGKYSRQGGSDTGGACHLDRFGKHGTVGDGCKIALGRDHITKFGGRCAGKTAVSILNKQGKKETAG
jgi:hypothetical protein